MKTLIKLGAAMLVAITIIGCSTTCSQLELRGRTLPDGQAELTFKCADKTVVVSADKIPQCLERCMKGEKCYDAP